MGVGIVANAAVLAAMSNPDIDAVVSLEGGLPSPSEDSLMKRSLSFDVTALRQPMLLITAPFDARNLSLLDQYRYSDRLRVEFPKMREFHFLSWGMLERLVPNVLGPPPGDTQAGFEWGARWVAAFLGGARSVDGAPEGVFERIVLPAATPVPSFVEAKRIIREQGIDALQAQPWPVETLADLYYHFAFRGGDDDFTRRLGILRVWTESHPRSARAAVIYAQMLRTAKQEEAAKGQFARALELLETDRDPWFDDARRERVTRLAREAIRTDSPR
jgi:hypothetical protein